jgi:hypothetical protein
MSELQNKDTNTPATKLVRKNHFAAVLAFFGFKCSNYPPLLSSPMPFQIAGERQASALSAARRSCCHRMGTFEQTTQGYADRSNDDARLDRAILLNNTAARRCRKG